MATVAQSLIALAESNDARDARDDALKAEIHDLLEILREERAQRRAVRALVDANEITSNTRIQRGVSSITTAITTSLGRSDVRVALIAIGYYLVTHVPGWIGSLK